MNQFQLISWSLIKRFYFNMGHFEAQYLLEHPYSNIFEYSNELEDEWAKFEFSKYAHSLQPLIASLWYVRA